MQSMMYKAGIQTAMLSLTAPGVEITPGREAQFQLARNVNEYAASLRDANPESVRFFAALPPLLDVQGALNEIEYAFDTLKADSVTLFTRYGDDNHYLGHSDFKPVWEELSARAAVVFIHPTHPVDTRLIHRALPQPIMEYPQETARTAMDLVFTGTKRAFPDCKIILSHGGGTLPILIQRIANLTTRPQTSFDFHMSAQDIVADIKSFYYDLALAMAPEVLDMLLKVFPHENILFGSDTPYAADGAVLAFNEYLNSFPLSEELRKKFAFGNAAKLFPRLGLM
jgi:6-methylsalicylate decarboxylase